MIRLEDVESLNEKLLNEKAMLEHETAFKMNEPFVYSWMATHAKSVLGSLAKRKSIIDAHGMTEIYENICRSYMFMYFLTTKNRDLLVERMIADDQFTAFLNGSLDDKYYGYDTTGMAEDCDLVKAKQSHHRLSLQALRRRLIPLIAEDVGMGRTPQKTLERIQELSSGKA